MNETPIETVAEEEGLLVGLADALKRKGWKIAELARRSGLHQNYLGQLVRKERNCSLKIMAQLSELLQASPNELLGYEAANQ